MSLYARRDRAAFALSVLVSLSGVGSTVLATEGSALAQSDAPATTPTKKPKKKKPKPAPAEPPADAAPAPAPPPADTPPPVETTTPPPPTDAAPAPPPAEPAAGADNSEPITDVYEKPGKTYVFLGLRYRGTIIPKFLINLFADEGATVYSNTIGLELDIRRDNFSLIPSIAYTSYGFGDTLYRNKGADPSQEFNYTDVNSSLKGIYVGADLMWSKQISKHFAFEYGAGFGLGAIFGTLQNDWVYGDPNGSLTAANGTRFSPCTATNATKDSGCNPASHTDPNPAKVNGYGEPNWLNGGSIPVVFPHIAIPELGIRYKPIKQLETRLVVGWSLAGFFFGLSGDYGFEPSTDKSEHKSEPAQEKPTSN